MNRGFLPSNQKLFDGLRGSGGRGRYTRSEVLLRFRVGGGIFVFESILPREAPDEAVGDTILMIL